MKFALLGLFAIAVFGSSSFAEENLPDRYITSKSSCDDRYVAINTGGFSMQKTCQNIAVTDEYDAAAGESCRNDGKEFVQDMSRGMSMNPHCKKLATAESYVIYSTTQCHSDFVPVKTDIMQVTCKRKELVETYPISYGQECADGYVQTKAFDFSSPGRCTRTEPIHRDPVFETLQGSVLNFSRKDCSLALRWRSQLLGIYNEPNALHSEHDGAANAVRRLDEVAANCSGYKAALAGPPQPHVQITAPGYTVNGGPSNGVR
jgi:hypothetical protein